MEIFSSPYWPVSVAASVFAWLGYAPELWRLWSERSSCGTGIAMWFIWIASSALSTAYALLSGAQMLVVVNVGFVCFLTVLVAALNCCLSSRSAERAARHHHLHRGQAAAPAHQVDEAQQRTQK